MKSRIACLVVLAVILPSAAHAAVITGTVVDAAGQPVAGAKVWLYYPHTTDDGQFDWGLVATGEAAADGSFTLEDPQREAPLPEKRQWYLSAYREGLAVGGAQTRDPGQPVELRLLEADVVPIEVRGADGAPLAGVPARMVTAYPPAPPPAGERPISLPPEVADACAVTTDGAGAGTFRALPVGWRGTFRVTAPGYGALTISGEGGLAALAGLRLQAAGSLRGSVTGLDDPALAAGARVQVDGRLGSLQAGETMTVDEKGQFACAELPPGPYRLYVNQQPTGPYHLRGNPQVEVRSGEATTVELTAEKVVPVTGRVVAPDTGAGIAGATVSLAQYESGYTTRGTTGPDGSFAVPCLPGTTRLDVYGNDLYVGREGVTVGVGAEGAVVPDLQLTLWGKLVVQVSDEGGAPVAGATVAVDRDQSWQSQTAETDQAGRAELRLVPGRAVARALKGDLASEPATVDVEAKGEPVTLVLRPGLIAGVTATLVDQDGQLPRTLQATLYEFREQSEGFLACPPPDGRGLLLRQDLKPGLQYQLHVEAPGCDPYESELWTAEAGVTQDLGTITLTRHVAAVAGTVVDAAGKPVAGVQVYNTGDAPAPVYATTDAEGRFRLEGLREGPVYVFADAPGCRLVGVPVQTGTENLRVTLEPKAPGTMGEPQPLRSLLPADKAQALAKQLLVDTLAQTQGGDSYDRASLLGRLATLDAPAAFEAAAAGGDDDAPVKRAVALQGLSDNPDEALALMREATPPEDLPWRLVDLARQRAQGSPELALRLLQEAEAALPAVPEAGWRIAITALVGARMRSFAEEHGTALLRQAAQEAGQLEPAELGAYGRGVVAENLCELDLEGALALMEPIGDQHERGRHLSNIARRIAPTDPDRALRLIEGVGEGFDHAQILARVLPFLPPARFEQAVKMARGIEDTTCRPMALAKLAAVAPVEQQTQLLEENAEDLMARGALGGGSGLGSPAQAMACLACVARRLGYDQYVELALRAFALGAAGARYGGGRDDSTYDQLSTARLLAFTAPELARQVVHRVLRRGEDSPALHAHSNSTVVAVAGEVDITEAMQLLAQMPRDAVDKQFMPRAEAVLQVVSCLLDPPEQRERHLLVETGQLSWLPVDEDY